MKLKSTINGPWTMNKPISDAAMPNAPTGKRPSSILPRDRISTAQPLDWSREPPPRFPALKRHNPFGLTPARGAVSHAEDRVPLLDVGRMNLTAVSSSPDCRFAPSRPESDERRPLGTRALGKNVLSGLGPAICGKPSVTGSLS